MKSNFFAIAAAVLLAFGAVETASAQNQAACDQYARDYAKQVSSGAEVLGGAAIGAVGGAIIGGLINGGKGAGTGALIGGGTGAVGGAVTHSQRYQEAYNYAFYNCMNQQQAAQPAGGGMQPWTPAWYQYCSSKYKSFNANTGYYTTYGGQQKFCQ
jgi:BA14K-like protein